MKASVKTPLVLAVIAGALGAYILLVERHRATTDQARAAHPRLLANFNRAEVTELQIDSARQGRLVLARTAGGTAASAGWRLVPGDTPAAPAAVADLLDALDGGTGGGGLEIDRETTAPPDTTGLAAPAARLTVTAGAHRWVIELGHADASNRGLFVRVDGDPRTLVISRRLGDLVAGGVAAFRERRLFAPGLTESATALAFESRAAPRRTLRKRGGQWLNNAGFFAARADTSQALGALAALQASAFPLAAAARPAAPPDQSLELTAALTASGRVRLDIWDGAAGTPIAGCDGDVGRTPSLALLSAEASDARPGSVCLDAAAVQRLWRALDAADRREPHLLAVDPAFADGVVLSQGDRRLHLRRDPAGGWRITEPAVQYAADPRAIDDWLARLAALTVSDAGDHANGAPGMGRSDTDGRRLTLEGAVATTIDVIALPRGRAVRVDRTGEAAPVTAAASLFAELDPDPLRFRSRAVLSLPRFDVTSIEIAIGPRHVTLRRGPGETWVVASDSATPAASPAVDGAAIDRLLAAVTDLQATRFPTPPPRFEPDRTIDFELREGATPRHQRLALSRTCLARLGDANDAPIFELSPTTCADLQRELTRSPKSP